MENINQTSSRIIKSEQSHHCLLLSFNDGLLPLSFGIFLYDLLSLGRDEQLGLLGLHQLVILPDGLRDLGLGDAHRVDLQARGHLLQVGLQGVLQVLVNLVEELDVDFLQCVARTELIELVVNLRGQNYQ